MMSTPRFVGYHDPETLPIKPGQVVTIPKGTLVKTVYHAPRRAGRTYKITVDHLLPGRTDRPFSADAPTHLENPKVCWAGTGGYWAECDLNDVPEAQS